MAWLVEGIYVVALVGGLLWLTLRIRKFVRAAAARKEVEARWAESFSEVEFQAFLETLRQKRDSQEAVEKDSSKPDDSSDSSVSCPSAPCDITTPAKR
jgi:hypothetical protein